MGAKMGLWQKIKTLLFTFTYKIWMSTLRVQFESQIPPKAFVLGIWHQDLPSALWVFRNSKMGIYVSQSKDAQSFALFMTHLGYSLIRGSSSKGQTRVRHLLKHLKLNQPIGMALDGPRGPALQVKPGTEWLVEKSGSEFIFLNIDYSSYWRLNTWDRMYIPKPFSLITVDLLPMVPKRPLAKNNSSKASITEFLRT